jgi:hypothetical protein
MCYKIILLLVFLTILNTYVQADSIKGDSLNAKKVEENKGNELYDLDKVTYQNSSNSYFFMNIFDGLLPIPSRFVLILNPDEIGLSSFADRLSDGLAGSISFGFFEDKKSYIVSLETNKTFKIERLTYKGFNVIKRSFKKETDVQVFPDQVFIHDDDHYLVVTDQNNNLWEFMLDNFQLE